MWIGDFNRHHPTWDNLKDTRLFTREVALEVVETLIKATADLGMELALAAGTPMHIHNVMKIWTRLDQVFITDHTLDKLVICETRENEHGLNTDHILIVTKLDAMLGRSAASEINNFRDIDWEDFCKEMEERLKKFNLPKRIKTQVELDHKCDRLTVALQETIGKAVPISAICPKSKRWWSKEIKELRRQFRKVGRKGSKYKNHPNHPIHKEYNEAQRKYDTATKYNKKHHWRDWLERATDLDLWTANKYISAPASDGGSTRIPALRYQEGRDEKIASANKGKSEILAKAFFPREPSVSANEEEHQAYPELACETHKITREQIRRQLKCLKPFKAPGPDKILNIVSSQCAELITD